MPRRTLISMALMLLGALALTDGFVVLAPSSARRAGIVRWAGEEPPPSAGTAWRKVRDSRVSE